MKKIIVNGGWRLRGEVEIGGSKNAALPLLFAGIVTASECRFSNLPRVDDVLRTLEILRALGARICFFENGDVVVDYASVTYGMPPAELTASIRASTYLLGAMLARFGSATLPESGGCNFGTRPIDQHLMGLAALGADITACLPLALTAHSGLCGTEITLKMRSVGATANLMIAATRAKGTTVIHNAAAEPHVAALADFLARAGAKIDGVGTDTVTVRGGFPLCGVHVTVIPDMIEVGTYLAAAMATGGKITARRVSPNDLDAVLAAFRAMGAELHVGSDFVTLIAPRQVKGIALETGPYPAFPTDLHPQMAALMAVGGRSDGQGSVTEAVFANRFQYLSELGKMGALYRVEGNTVTLTPAPLHPATVTSPDLRGGAALLVAALATRGRTELLRAETIGRGYEHVEKKLTLLGADVKVGI